MGNNRRIIATAKTRPQEFEVKKVQIKYIRFIFICNTENKSHVNTFENAALTLISDYKKFFPNHRIEKHIVMSAEEINKILSSQSDMIVLSIDFIGHGRDDRIGIMDEDNAVSSLIMDDSGYFFTTWFTGMLRAKDIDFSALTDNAKIEIHGCRTADKEHIDNNIAKNLSETIYHAGKKKSYVIGHGNKANPGKDSKRQDYRHDARFIFHNGNIVLYKPKEGERYTIESGYLSEDGIEKAITEQFDK